MTENEQVEDPNHEIIESGPVISFISGLSGTGKSTLVDYFTKHPIEGWSFYDYDKGEHKCPDDESEHLEWRKKQSEYWLEVALKNFAQGLKTAVMGLSLYPTATEELESAGKFGENGIHFALIHCDPEERKQRLFDRGTPRHWQGHKPFYDEFYQIMREYGDAEFDTTSKGIEETAEEIKQYLEGIK